MHHVGSQTSYEQFIFHTYSFAESSPKYLFSSGGTGWDDYEWLPFCTRRATSKQFNLVSSLTLKSSHPLLLLYSVIGESSDWLRWVHNHISYHFFSTCRAVWMVWRHWEGSHRVIYDYAVSQYSHQHHLNLNLNLMPIVESRFSKELSFLSTAKRGRLCTC